MHFLFHVRRSSCTYFHCIILILSCHGKFLRDCINENIHSDKSHNFFASPVGLAGSKAVSYFNRPSKGAESAVQMILEKKMPQNFDNYREVEVKDCVFIKGLRTNSNIKVSDVR